MLITATGLVVRSYTSGNTDRILHILTEEYGRLSVMVKGSSSKKSNHVAPYAQLLTYGNYELYQGHSGDLYWLRGGSVETSFYKLTEDIVSMALAAYLCDVAADLTPEEAGETNSGLLLKDLLNSLYVLLNGMRSPAMVKAVFELRAAALMGYCPDLSGCGTCGQKTPDNAYLDVMGGRLICADCQTKRNRVRNTGHTADEFRGHTVVCPISSSVLTAMRYIAEAPPKKIFSFSMKDTEEERALERAVETFLLTHLEREYETLKFYRSVSV